MSVELMSKADAIAKVRAAGFTHKFERGASGDFGHGSRLYYASPSEARNPHGWPVSYASVSMVLRGRWSYQIFGEAAP